MFNLFLSEYLPALLLSLSLTGTFGQTAAIPHAHNDYEHDRPLTDAVSAGFRSVEADVHLKNGKLLVGHNSVGRRSPELKTLYLQPLDKQIKGGKWQTGKTFFLMIDLKTDGEETLKVLEQELLAFPVWLESNGPVTVILSGNVPKEKMLEGSFKGIRIDGRPSDLEKGISALRMPWVSDRFSNWGTTDANGNISGESLERIAALAARVHAEGKMLRLWATPDHPVAWQQLRKAGADVLNTDRLQEMSAFLSVK